MKPESWLTTLHTLYDQSVAKYRNGLRSSTDFFDTKETAFLTSIGITPIQVVDYVEDFVRGGDPDWETYLLLAAARRDYFIFVQNSTPLKNCVAGSELPSKRDQLDGIAWLPRIIRKADHFLKGCLSPDLMYGCGGDRPFLKSHGINLPDFLSMVRAANGDEQKTLKTFKAHSIQF
ncbi:MAG: hypothetical protein ACK5NG_01710 [Chthoniobacterales bacterium]